MDRFLCVSIVECILDLRQKRFIQRNLVSLNVVLVAVSNPLMTFI